MQYTLWWYIPCFSDGNGGGCDNGVTLFVTLLGAVMVDMFIFIVDVGNWMYCSRNSAMVLFGQLGCSLLLQWWTMGSLMQLYHMALCNCISSDCGNFSNTFLQKVIWTGYTRAVEFLCGGECGRLCMTLADFGKLQQTLANFRRFLQVMTDFGKPLQPLEELLEFARNSQTFTGFGIFYHAKADFDRFWQTLAVFGRLYRLWQALTGFCRPGQALAGFGRFWQTLTDFGRL